MTTNPSMLSMPKGARELMILLRDRGGKAQVSDLLDDLRKHVLDQPQAQSVLPLLLTLQFHRVVHHVNAVWVLTPLGQAHAAQLTRHW